MILTPTGGLTDAGGFVPSNAGDASLPYVTSRGFTAPTEEPTPYTQDPNAPVITRGADFNPGGTSPTVPAGALPGDSGGGSAGSPFDKLLGALGMFGATSGGGGGGGALAAPITVPQQSGGTSMTRLLIYGAIGVAIYFVGKKMGWW